MSVYTSFLLLLLLLLHIGGPFVPTDCIRNLLNIRTGGNAFNWYAACAVCKWSFFGEFLCVSYSAIISVLFLAPGQKGIYEHILWCSVDLCARILLEKLGQINGRK